MPKKIFLGWLNDEGHSIFTGGKVAKTSQREGGNFTVFANYISGVNVEIIPYRRIVQKWRTKDFSSSDEDSNLELVFTYKDGQTIIIFTHTNIPDNLSEKIRRFWKEEYFINMKDYPNKDKMALGKE